MMSDGHIFMHIYCSNELGSRCSLILTALQLQRAVLRVQWETAEVHGAKRSHGDPATYHHSASAAALTESHAAASTSIYIEIRSVLVVCQYDLI